MFILATANTVATALSSAGTVEDHWGGPWPWWPIIPFLWLLFLIAVVSTFAFFGRRRWHQLNTTSGRRAGEARLAERYAGGEIDEREYEQRLATLKRLGGV
jgi:putative membrane protein